MSEFHSSEVREPDRAEQVRGGGGVVLADGFALDFNALKICAVLLDIGDQIHRHIVRERVGRLIAEADRAHAVIDADHRAGIRKREIGRHAEVFLHIGAHGVDKLGRGDQLGRIHLVPPDQWCCRSRRSWGRFHWPAWRRLPLP